ncbi:MAG: hypothetical protein PUB93_00730, partial [Firmicutes bacterium]|nr:hypothetical protein [Bacillota bacterium]
PVDPPVDPVDPPVDPVDPPVDPVDPPVDPVDPPVDPVKPEGVIEDFENGLPSGADFYAPNTFPRIEELENGNHVLAGQYSADGTAWHGISNANYDLGKSVNQIRLTFIQNGENPVTMAAGAFWFDTDAGSLYPVELTVDGNVYTLTFDTSFSVIKTFAIEISNAMGLVYVDDLMICPQEDPELIVDFEDGDLSNVQSSEFTSYEIIELDGEKWLSAYSTAGDWIYLNNLDYTSDTPLTAIDVVVRCEADITSNWVYLYTDAGDFYASGVTNEGNIYHFTFAVEFTTINRFSMLVPANTTVQIRQIKAHTDTPQEEQNPNLIKDFADGSLTNVVIATGTLTVQQLDGANWLTISCGAPDWLYLKNLNYSNGKQMQAIQIELKTEAVLTAGSVYLYTDAGGFYASGVTHEGDVYTFTFNTAFTTLNEVSMLVNENTTLQIKQILAVE